MTQMTDTSRTGGQRATDEQPVVAVRNLVKHFPVRSKGLIRRTVGIVHAVCDISFDINHNETLSLVGESGCGKTTTGRLMLNLVPATSGSVTYGGKDITKDQAVRRCGRYAAICRSSSKIRLRPLTRV